MIKLALIALLSGVIGFAVPQASAQTSFSDSLYFGIWQDFGEVMDISKFPEINGRLCNFTWKDIEIANNVWTWNNFDSDLTARAKDGLPIIFMIYTEEDAPDWLFDYGVPKVAERDNNGQVIAYTPYYADTTYKNFFKRMITKVHQHIETLPDSVREKIIAVQGCYGSTGDYIGYKGTVDAQYNLSGEDFYNLFTEFSLYYYNEYLTTSPKIYLLSNPGNTGDDQMNWLIHSCPKSWVKCGSLGKGFELNDERDKSSWLYSLLNNPQNGEYIRSRSELQGSPTDIGWWSEYPYRNMFALMTYCIYWGLDWSNQTNTQITDSLYKSSFDFYNKYAGQKDPLTSSNAVCALKDVLDASDTVRFPTAIYGNADRNDTMRYKNIVARFTKAGARLEDPLTATLKEEDNLVANGINDVGWNLLPGNYERNLHQLRANETSAGYWNVDAPADSTSMYGKYARGFNILLGRTALYFDVDSLFLNKAPLNGSYPVSIDITYLDKGTGGFKLYYDSKNGGVNKQSIIIVCSNSGKWKTASITLYDAYFGNRASNGSDFYIRALNAQNVIFSVVELSRPDPKNPKVGLSASGTLQFDSVCVNTTGVIQSFLLTGSFLNGSNVLINPVNGYSFSTRIDSGYTDSLIISNYGTGFTKSIFVKFRPVKAGIYNGDILITGGGYAGTNIPIKGSSKNSRPALSANVSNISCYNARNGAIDLILTGGTGPFSYSWASDASNFKSTDEDIDSLTPANYTVTVTSLAGCTVSATYPVTQPADLTAIATLDSNILCKGGTTTITVAATGGTAPYTGTGVFTVSTGNASFDVTDAKGCEANTNKIGVANGDLTAPSKPGPIKGDDAGGVCHGGTFTYSISAVSTATSYTWIPAAGTSVIKQNINQLGIALSVPASFTGGDISVIANNVCGSSPGASKTLAPEPDNPVGISGPTSVLINQIGLIYKVVSPIEGVTYTWSASNGAKIVGGQGTWRANVTWGLLAGKINVRASNDCGSSKAISLDVGILNALLAGSSSKSISKNTSSKTSLQILPNPSKDIACLLFNTKISMPYAIEVTDVMGKVLFTHKFIAVAGENKEQINLQPYSNGLYFITLINNNGNREMMKVIKE